MAYTVQKLAKLSGVSIRTLHFYDEIGLLKPAYYGENGYRFYEEEQLLLLQQILFYRELGIELKKIQKILGQNDFNKEAALQAHRHLLEKNVSRTKQLIKTIDKTIEHLRGTKKMRSEELYGGFITKEKQAEYEKYLKNRIGEDHPSFTETTSKTKNWNKDEWDRSKLRGDVFWNQLVILKKKNAEPQSDEVQRVVRLHYEWLKDFWTPDKESYPALGEMYTEFEWKKFFDQYDNEHPKLARLMADGMKIFAEKELS